MAMSLRKAHCRCRIGRAMQEASRISIGIQVCFQSRMLEFGLGCEVLFPGFYGQLCSFPYALYIRNYDVSNYASFLCACSIVCVPVCHLCISGMHELFLASLILEVVSTRISACLQLHGVRPDMNRA